MVRPYQVYVKCEKVFPCLKNSQLNIASKMKHSFKIIKINGVRLKVPLNDVEDEYHHSNMFQKLPKEMFLEILKNLSHTDLLKVSEVSKRFRDSATDPSLWKDFDISHRTLDNKIQLLRLSRFKKLKTLTLTTTTNDSGDKNKILELLMNIDLEELRLERFNFKKIDKELLANVICKTKHIGIFDIKLQKLGREIIEKISGGNIKELHLLQMDFSGIDSRTVAKSINKLQVFMPQVCFFDQSQIMEIIKEILRETNLKRLYLSAETLKNVPAKILSKALNKMELLIISGEESLSSDQLMELFREMSHQTNLRSLLFNFPDSSEGSLLSIPADVLIKAINNLKILSVSRLNFSGNQIKSIFNNIATHDSCRIRHLKLSYWDDFSPVDLKTLRAVIKLIDNNDFQRYLQVEIVDRSITELLRFEEEEEEKLSDGEMCQRWAQVMREAGDTAESLLSCKERPDVFSALQWNLQRALTTPSLLQMADTNKYNLNTSLIFQLCKSIS